jgi:hypothetical protein
MKPISWISLMLVCAAPPALAQDEQLQNTLDKLKDLARQVELNRLELDQKAKTLAINGAVMGPVVKNAPYSAVEVTETTQTLGDGTRIHREKQTNVYRDSEGRVRRETPEQVTIWDPVANTSYTLNPKTQTARRLALGENVIYSNSGGQPGNFIFRLAVPAPGTESGFALQNEKVIAVARGAGARSRGGEPSAKTESLGKQAIEGVPAEGTRTSSTIDAGAIGNDRPIQITSESWYSSELQTLVKSVHSDPRTGDEVFRLTNVSRAEPPSILFQVPPDYQIVGRK